MVAGEEGMEYSSSRTVKGCARTNQLWNEDIRHDLYTFHLHGNFKEHEGE
jgi:hypothetical protein